MKNLKCLLCHKKIYSGAGQGCKMCGMILNDKGREFCSKICRTKYKTINKLKRPEVK